MFYPFASFVSHSIHSGQSPFWNPYVFSGFPMISDPQSMMFSPVSLGLILAVDKPSFYWFDIIELLHLLLGGLGMLLVSIRLGRSPLAALFSSAVFMFGGSASARMQHVPIIYAYAYFPFALLALEEMLSTNRKRWAICFGVLAGIMSAHMNQVAFLLSLVLIGYYLHRAISSESLAKFVASRWRVTVLAALTGALVLAIPLFLVFQFLPFSNRIGIPYEVAVAGSMDPVSFLTLVFRNFYGNAQTRDVLGTLGHFGESVLCRNPADRFSSAIWIGGLGLTGSEVSLFHWGWDSEHPLRDWKLDAILLDCLPSCSRRQSLQKTE